MRTPNVPSPLASLHSTVSIENRIERDNRPLQINLIPKMRQIPYGRSWASTSPVSFELGKSPITLGLVVGEFLHLPI